ncbi:MAG: Uma2 family endonuclease [Acidobacteriota bacterium]|nr:Uma2 family endonuclease [Acidobacteriota bacterium]
MATEISPLVTVSDLDLMPDDGNRYEVIEGEILVSRAPGLAHQRVSRNITVIVSNYLERNPIGEILATPGVMFSELSGVIPDLIFISNERRQEIASGERVTGAPDLVIEIVSPGTENARRDRVAKRQLYGKYGVKEYWVVDPERQDVEIYRSQDGTLELIGSFADEEKLTSPHLPGFECMPVSIFKM